MSAPMQYSDFAGWMQSGHCGLSSKTIAGTLSGSSGEQHHPYDPSDFVRCERLLREVPRAREHFPAMRSVSPTWNALVDAWDELVALLESEVPGCFTGAEGSAPLTYQRMKELRGVS